MSSPALYVLFEGPWLFSPHEHHHVVATTFGDLPVGSTTIPHTCLLSSWNATAGALAPPPGCTATPTLDHGQHLHATVHGEHRSASFAETFGAAYNSLNAVYIKQEHPRVQCLDTDRQVTLPMPSEVLLGGRRTGTDVVSGGTTLAVQPYTVAVFKYLPNDAGTAPKLTVWDGSRELFTTDCDHHVLFRMQFSSSKADHCAACGSDQEHIIASFTELMKRIQGDSGETGLTLNIRTLEIDQSPVDGISPVELGLTLGPIQAHSSDPSNCAGGNVGVGG